MKFTQKRAVIEYIRLHGSITPMQAFSELGITKLATVVSRLIREDDVPFIKEPQEEINRYGRKVTFMKYRLDKEKLK